MASSIANAYTIEEARTMLRLWKDCEIALATGQAKSYRIGTREYTSFDLAEVRDEIQRFANIVEALMNGRAKTRAVRVIPRDL